jgi:hypothetical protein
MMFLLSCKEVTKKQQNNSVKIEGTKKNKNTQVENRIKKFELQQKSEFLGDENIKKLVSDYKKYLNQNNNSNKTEYLSYNKIPRFNEFPILARGTTASSMSHYVHRHFCEGDENGRFKISGEFNGENKNGEYTLTNFEFILDNHPGSKRNLKLDNVIVEIKKGKDDSVLKVVTYLSKNNGISTSTLSVLKKDVKGNKIILKKGDTIEMQVFLKNEEGKYINQEGKNCGQEYLKQLGLSLKESYYSDDKINEIIGKEFDKYNISDQKINEFLSLIFWQKDHFCSAIVL